MHPRGVGRAFQRAFSEALSMYFFFVLASLMVANPALAYLSAGMKVRAPVPALT